MSEFEDRSNAPAPQTDDQEDTGSGIPVVSSLRSETRTLSSRRLLNWASVAVAAILLLVLGARWLPGIVAARMSALATPTRAIVQPDTRPMPTPGAGWLAAGPPWLQTISFTADGSVAYACGMPLDARIPLFIHVVRYDPVQHIWQDMIGPAYADQCWMGVSPTDASELALIVRRCSGNGVCGGDFGSGHLYLSHDGGKSWSQIWLPSNQDPQHGVWLNDGTLALVTVDTTPPTSATPSPYDLLLIRPGGWFSLVDTGRLLGPNFTQLQHIDVFSSGATLYAAMDAMPCSTGCFAHALVRTSDEGQHWSTGTLEYKGTILTVESAQFATNTLLAWDTSSRSLALVRSTDGGATWQPLPLLDNGTSQEIGAYSNLLPDNTIIAWDNDVSERVYMLPPGSNTWLPIATAPVGLQLGVQCDAQGHPLALWALASISYGGPNPGLAYHPVSHNLP